MGSVRFYDYSFAPRILAAHIDQAISAGIRIENQILWGKYGRRLWVFALDGIYTWRHAFSFLLVWIWINSNSLGSLSLGSSRGVFFSLYFGLFILFTYATNLHDDLPHSKSCVSGTAIFVISFGFWLSGAFQLFLFWASKCSEVDSVVFISTVLFKGYIGLR